MDNFNELEWYKKSLQKLIKPCPFCGGKDIGIHVPNKQGMEDVKCFTCGCTMQKALGVGVVGAWNERVIEKLNKS